MPKSVIIARPSRASRMLLGFTSRWTIPRTCATPSARATSSPIRATSVAGSGPVSVQAGGEVLALDEVHDQERTGGIRARVHARDDVLVAQDGGREGLAPKSVGQVAVGADLGSKQLERDIASEAGVVGAIDRRHPASPDDVAQPVAVRDEPLAVRNRFGSLGHAADDRPVSPNGSPGRGRPRAGLR